MKKYKNLMWACLALLAVPAGAQTTMSEEWLSTSGGIRFMVLLSW